MIDLRDSTVLVNNVKEYRVITKIAKKQGFRWASGDSLNRICCHFQRDQNLIEDMKHIGILGVADVHEIILNAWLQLEECEDS